MASRGARGPVLAITCLLALGRCGAADDGQPPAGSCSTSADCPDQVGYGKVCVEGLCQECGADSDCMAGFMCRSNKCTPKPQCATPEDCPMGQTCVGERCVPE